MARKPRLASPVGVYHFMTRGVNKKRIFHNDEDFRKYLTLSGEYAESLSIRIFHYCVMSNHVHFVLAAEDQAAISRFAYFTHRRYAYYYCKKYKWAEQVFRRSYVCVPILDEAHLLETGRYVERNPLEAKLVQDLVKYRYSSYSYYSEGVDDSLVSASPVVLAMAPNESQRQAIYRFYILHDRKQEPRAVAAS